MLWKLLNIFDLFRPLLKLFKAHLHITILNAFCGTFTQLKTRATLESEAFSLSSQVQKWKKRNAF